MFSFKTKQYFFCSCRIRASVRTFNPKQLKYEDKSDTKFKFATFNKNVNRVKAATAHMDPEVAVRELKLVQFSIF